MLNVKTLQETQNIISHNFSNIRTQPERVPLLNAVGRVLVNDVTADERVPGFDRSTVDGYAIKASDTFGAGESIPSILEIKGEVYMGAPNKCGSHIHSGECVRIPTGGQLPEGCDAVVMLEDTDEMNDGYCYINKAVPPCSNIIFAGDDMKEGETVLLHGKRLTPPNIGALAALGITHVDVYAKPIVGVLSTGDEIIDISKKPEASQVRDVNTYVISAGIIEAGGIPLTLGICPDSPDALMKAATDGMEKCDMLIISGGSSVGERDLTLEVIKRLGGDILIHGIAMKPGKPAILGSLNGRPIWGLPGHPVGAYFIFHLNVVGQIYSMSGIQENRAQCEAVLKEKLPSNHGREECVPVYIKWNGCGLPEALPIAFKSGLISKLSSASGYVRIPRDSEGISAGETIQIVLF